MQKKTDKNNNNNNNNKPRAVLDHTSLKMA